VASGQWIKKVTSHYKQLATRHSFPILACFVTFCLLLHIINRVIVMNQAIFHDLYQRYAPDVYRFALWLSGDLAEADDIASETFVRAWTSSSQIRTETMKAYLFTIARNLFLQQRRQQKRQVALEQALLETHSGPQGLVEDRLALAAVLQQLQDLPESERTALLLRVQHELPYAEIARVLGISLASAKVKVHRARLKLTAVRTAWEVSKL
jgi:RNA polymerase sigma-70 factor, ECF subfamily